MSDLPPDINFFKIEVKEYNELDEEISSLTSQIKPLQAKVKELKAKKSELQGNICEFMAKNKIDQCNVSNLDKIPSKGIKAKALVYDPEIPTPMLSQAGSSTDPYDDNASDVASITNSVNSIKLTYKASKSVKPVSKEFIRAQCSRFYLEKAKSDEFKKLSDGEKGAYLFDYLYNDKENREVVEKPLLKKMVI